MQTNSKITAARDDELIQYQQYMSQEINRSGQLIKDITQIQLKLQNQRREIEDSIMVKKGFNDQTLWETLSQVRLQLDCLYDEKLMLVKKMYNLVQKFIQMLDHQIEEELKIINKRKLTSGGIFPTQSAITYGNLSKQSLAQKCQLIGKIGDQKLLELHDYDLLDQQNVDRLDSGSSDMDLLLEDLIVNHLQTNPDINSKIGHKHQVVGMLEPDLKLESSSLNESLDDFQQDDISEICQECHKARPQKFPLTKDIEWVGCDRCGRWYHVQCMGFKNAAQLQNRDFICCDKVTKLTDQP